MTMQAKTLLKLSVAAAVATIVMKTAAWWITDSVGLLSDAMESFVNLASALFAIAMVTVAERPADEDHPFGHTKAEYFSSGFEGLLIVGAAVAIIWAAAHRFVDPQPLQALSWGLALALASSLLNTASSVEKTGTKANSRADSALRCPCADGCASSHRLSR